MDAYSPPSSAPPYTQQPTSMFGVSSQVVEPTQPMIEHQPESMIDRPLMGYNPVGNQPVIQQPGPTNTVITNTTIIQAPSPFTHRPWTSDLCSCCIDITSCVCTAFCGPCYICHVSKSMGEGCCMPCCIPPTSALAMLRVRLRTEEKIYGSISMDYCSSCCCWGCVLCQLKRELDVIRTRQDAQQQLQGQAI